MAIMGIQPFQQTSIASQYFWKSLKGSAIVGTTCNTSKKRVSRCSGFDLVEPVSTLCLEQQNTCRNMTAGRSTLHQPTLWQRLQPAEEDECRCHGAAHQAKRADDMTASGKAKMIASCPYWKAFIKPDARTEGEMHDANIILSAI